MSLSSSWTPDWGMMVAARLRRRVDVLPPLSSVSGYCPPVLVFHMCLLAVTLDTVKPLLTPSSSIPSLSWKNTSCWRECVYVYLDMGFNLQYTLLLMCIMLLWMCHTLYIPADVSIMLPVTVETSHFLQECRPTLASRFVLLIKTGYSIALTLEMTAARYQSLHTRTVWYRLN